MFKSYLRRIASLLRTNSTKRNKLRHGARRTLIVESLESRALLAPLAWSTAPSLPIPAAGIVAQPSGAKTLVMDDGSTNSFYLTATTPSWQATTSPTVQPLDFARSGAAAGPLGNGYYVVFGGAQNGFATSAVTQYDPNTVTVTDGATNQTKSLKSMNLPRASFGGVTDPSSYTSYAIGGVDNNGTPLASVESYSPSANTWTYVAALPQTLYSESAVDDGAGHIYTFGGVGANGAIVNNVYRYTISTNTWDQVAPLQVAVRDSAAVLGSNGSIYVLGGATSTGTSATVESFNVGTNSWNVESSLPQPISSAAATSDSLGRIELLGGNDVNGNPLATVYVSQQLTAPDAAPTITSTAALSGVVNSQLAYQVTSTASPQATYSLSSAPAGMTINPNTGLVTWSPNNAAEATSNGFTVVASNSLGQATHTYPAYVYPAAPTGLIGSNGALSWNASPDPNVSGYDVYKQSFVHSPRGSGGSYYYTRIATDVNATSLLVAGGTYQISAVNSLGLESARTSLVSAAGLSAPDLYVATTTSGADISSLSVTVGQTGQINLISYGTPYPTFSVLSGPSGVSVDPATGHVTYVPSGADVGNQVVTFAATNSLGTSQYNFTFIVSAINPTISLTGGTIIYDGNSHAATATAVESDGVTPVNGVFAYTYNGSTTIPNMAGTYAVTATFTSNDPAYANATATTTLTINPATPAVTVASGPYDYDGTAHGATATAVGVDGSTPVDGSFQITYNGDPNAPTAPGLYAVATVFTSNDPNYSSVTVNGNLIITSPGTVVPTLSLIDGSATYDGTPHGDAATAVGSDLVTPVAGNFLITYNGSTTVPTQAGNYAVVANFISSDPNYADTTTAGTLTIGAATPSVSITSAWFVYNGAGQAVTETAVGVDGVTPVNGTFSVTYNGSTTLPVNAGAYNVAVSFTSNDPNYASTSTSGTMTISPAVSSVGLLSDWNFTYDGTPKNVTGIATGIDGVTPINGTFTYAYSQYYYPYTPLASAPTDVGNYAFTETFTSADPNYQSGSFTWQMNVNPASPTIIIGSGPVAYSGGSQNAPLSAVGIDGVTPVAGTWYVTYNGSTNAPSAAGTYNVNAVFYSGNSDYYTSGGSGTFTIVKATPQFSTLSSPAINVGTSSVTVTGRIAAGSAVPSGDDVAITLNGITQAAPVSNNGNFTASFTVAGLGTGSYPITYKFLGDATRFNAAGTSGTASGTLTVQSAPTVLTSPANQTAVAGGSVTFMASALGYPAPSVQWQQSTNGTTYTNVAGATSVTYTISSVTASQNNYHYRAVFTNNVGSATTAAATLTVQTAPTVTTNPTNPSVNAGQNATFTSAASGNPSPTVQWQVSTNGGATFTPIAGATSTTLTVSTVTAAQNGYVYQAVFTNGVGSVTSSNATLSVKYAPTVTSSPTSQTIVAGRAVTFSASASGNPAPTVQWQQSTNGGNSYSNVSGATNLTYTINNPTASQNGYLYRAVFANSVGSATSSAATLTVQFAPTTTTNPANVTVNAGQNATFTAAASGNPAPSVQWQSSTDGVNYSNVAGATGGTLTLSGALASQNGLKVRAVFTNSVGTVTSSAATLTVQYAPAIVASPTNQSVKAGSTATFTASAAANPTPTVQWQVSTNGGTNFVNLSGATSTTLTLNNVTSTQKGYQYRAVFTNSLGSATTLIATLTVL